MKRLVVTQLDRETIKAEVRFMPVGVVPATCCLVLAAALLAVSCHC